MVKVSQADRFQVLKASNGYRTDSPVSQYYRYTVQCELRTPKGFYLHSVPNDELVFRIIGNYEIRFSFLVDKTPTTSVGHHSNDQRDGVAAARVVTLAWM